MASLDHQPPKRLAILVSLPQNTTHEGQSGINILYTGISRQAYCDLDPDSQNPDNQEVYQHFRSVVGAVLLAFNPLSMESFILLQGFDTLSDISTVLNPLHSIFLVPEITKDPVRTFLMDPKRYKDVQFFVDPTIHHTEILLSCLQLMEQTLRRNICDLDGIPLDKVDDLSDCRKEHIRDALEYACQSRTKHLMKSPSSGPSAKKAQEKIDKFFAMHLLHWIELLTIMEKLDASVYSLNDIKQWYTLVSLGISLT